jgi:hypothetical protein
MAILEAMPKGPQRSLLAAILDSHPMPTPREKIGEWLFPVRRPISLTAHINTTVANLNREIGPKGWRIVNDTRPHSGSQYRTDTVNYWLEEIGAASAVYIGKDAP